MNTCERHQQEKVLLHLSQLELVLLVTVARYYWTIEFQGASFIKHTLYLPLICDQGKVVLDNVEAHWLNSSNFVKTWHQCS